MKIELRWPEAQCDATWSWTVTPHRRSDKTRRKGYE